MKCHGLDYFQYQLHRLVIVVFFDSLSAKISDTSSLTLCIFSKFQGFYSSSLAFFEESQLSSLHATFLHNNAVDYKVIQN